MGLAGDDGRTYGHVYRVSQGMDGRGWSRIVAVVTLTRVPGVTPDKGGHGTTVGVVTIMDVPVTMGMLTVVGRY